MEFRDASLGIPYGCRATILRHNKAWKFHVRFHDQLNPRERQVGQECIGNAMHIPILFYVDFIL